MNEIWHGMVSDGKEESLEEISSKLIKSILQEKSELENQYAEMVELQSGASSFNVPNLGFGYLEDEDDASIEEMAQHCDKLQVLKESLKTQQVMLRNAVNSLSKATIGEMTCKQCREHLKVDPRSSSTQKIPETVDLESPHSWGMAHPATYNEKIQRQLDQVAEPPSADGMEDFTTQMTPPNKPDLVSNIGRMCPLCMEGDWWLLSFLSMHTAAGLSVISVSVLVSLELHLLASLVTCGTGGAGCSCMRADCSQLPPVVKKEQSEMNPMRSVSHRESRGSITVTEIREDSPRRRGGENHAQNFIATGSFVERGSRDSFFDDVIEYHDVNPRVTLYPFSD
uniref:Uncharacterized protein n=1 Tax=Timema cristinae TaxID=61476 RepID=A0A7R9D485_TIMCR|nr:unnamed protein product [Timema cristinae]